MYGNSPKRPEVSKKRFPVTRSWRDAVFLPVCGCLGVSVCKRPRPRVCVCVCVCVLTLCVKFPCQKNVRNVNKESTETAKKKISTHQKYPKYSKSIEKMMKNVRNQLKKNSSKINCKNNPTMKWGKFQELRVISGALGCGILSILSILGILSI